MWQWQWFAFQRTNCCFTGTCLKKYGPRAGLQTCQLMYVWKHSPIPFDHALAQEISKLGEVTGLIAPNLNHFLFLADWAEHFKSARVYCTPAAAGTSLAEKLRDRVASERLVDLGSSENTFEGLEQRLLEGAPVNLNETIFLHRPSETLITSDTFYGGYNPEDPHLSWFCRVRGLWLKLRLSKIERRLVCIAGMV